MTVICPNCGKKLHVPAEKPTNGKCGSCGVSFTAEYADDGSITVSVKSEKTFWEKHPRFTKGLKAVLGVGFFAGLTWLAVKPKVDELIDTTADIQDAPSTPILPDEASMQNETDSVEEPQEDTNYEEREIPVSGGVVKLSGNRRPSQKKRETAAENGYPNLAPDEIWRVSSTRVIETPVNES